MRSKRSSAITSETLRLMVGPLQCLPSVVELPLRLFRNPFHWGFRSSRVPLHPPVCRGSCPSLQSDVGGIFKGGSIQCLHAPFKDTHSAAEIGLSDGAFLAMFRLMTPPRKSFVRICRQPSRTMADSIPRCAGK